MATIHDNLRLIHGNLRFYKNLIMMQH